MGRGGPVRVAAKTARGGSRTDERPSPEGGPWRSPRKASAASRPMDNVRCRLHCSGSPHATVILNNLFSGFQAVCKARGTEMIKRHGHVTEVTQKPPANQRFRGLLGPGHQPCPWDRPGGEDRIPWGPVTSALKPPACSLAPSLPRGQSPRAQGRGFLHCRAWR